MTDSMGINLNDGAETPAPKMLLKFDVHKTRKRGRKKLAQGAATEPENGGPGRVPRISKLMALAIHLQNLVDQGAIRDYAEIARLTGLTRARVTQIMNLNLLAPRIQEEILFLPRIHSGQDPITERDIRSIALEPRWDKQLNAWQSLSEKCSNNGETVR
jgi:hypothetical protein